MNLEQHAIIGKKLTNRRIDYYLEKGWYGEALQQKFLARKRAAKRRHSASRRHSPSKKLSPDEILEWFLKK